ncbi:MAG: YlbF family regulator [Anaerolineaceae bacterium]
MDNKESNGLKVTDTSEKLMEATTILAESLSQSEPFLEFRTLDEKLKADQQATQLLAEFSELQQKVLEQQYTASVVESDLNRLRELRRAIGKNELIQKHASAQEAATAFLREVNREISSLLGVDFASLTRRSNCC